MTFATWSRRTNSIKPLPYLPATPTQGDCLRRSHPVHPLITCPSQRAVSHERCDHVNLLQPHYEKACTQSLSTCTLIGEGGPKEGVRGERHLDRDRVVRKHDGAGWGGHGPLGWIEKRAAPPHVLVRVRVGARVGDRVRVRAWAWAWGLGTRLGLGLGLGSGARTSSSTGRGVRCFFDLRQQKRKWIGAHGNRVYHETCVAFR